MHLTITRHHTTTYACDSRLYINGEHICDCTENINHLIPPGTYRIELKHLKSEHRKVPILIPIHPPSSTLNHQSSTILPPPYLKIGNGIHTLHHGQILIGKALVPGVVIHSRPIFLTLYDRIYHSIRRGHTVTITIQ